MATENEKWVPPVSPVDVSDIYEIAQVVAVTITAAVLLVPLMQALAESVEKGPAMTRAELDSGAEINAAIAVERARALWKAVKEST